MQIRSGTDAVHADGIFRGNKGLSKQVSQLFQEPPKSLVIGLWEGETIHIRKGCFHFGELHWTIVDEDHGVGGDVPGLEDALDGFRLGTPMNFYREECLLAD